MRRKFKLLIVATSALIISSGCSAAVSNYKEVQHTRQQIQDLQSQYQNVQKEKQDLQKQKSEDQKKLKEKDQTEQELRQKIKELSAIKAEKERQRIALLATQEASAAALPSAPAVVAGCGDNSYASYIYEHESGCNLNAVNAGGCRGIGQACPGSKLPCGADYACQNAFFTKYANDAYGGWAGAYAFWLNHHWW